MDSLEPDSNIIALLCNPLRSQIVTDELTITELDLSLSRAHGSHKNSTKHKERGLTTQASPLRHVQKEILGRQSESL